LPRGTAPAELGTPELTVVVIGYNDRANLPDAISSVLGQTLRHLEVVVVDDASTDGSAEVAERIAERDPRVRVVRLPENSGGCSRPRNVGLEQARAPYVMFLDSDDVYDRHACKNLLLTAERTGADVVAGQVVRQHVSTQRVPQREAGWIERLYTRRAVYEGIRENPELFFDPLSTNKLYRRDFLDQHGIRFPEGVHYEDSLFSTKVYCHAARIALVPNVIYFWRVVRDAEELSISQRRFEIDNFRDRIAVHRMMDDFLHEQGADDLKVYKDFKFVRNDLRIYLSDLPNRDVAYQRSMLQLAADYLDTVGDETLAMCDPVERVCVHMIRLQDLDETLRTVDYLRYGFKLSTRLVERDGRVYWSQSHLDDPGCREVLDVTDMGWHRLPWDRLSLHNSLTSVKVRRGRLLLEGTVLNQLDRIPPDARLRLAVSIRSRERPADRRRVRVSSWRHLGDRIDYAADIDLSRSVPGIDVGDGVWDWKLEIAWDGKTATPPFSVDPALVADLRIPVRTRLGGVASAYLEPFVTTRMNLALKQAPDEGREQVVGRVNRGALRLRKAVQWRSSKASTGPAVKAQAYRVFRRLPVIPGLAVFESHMGRQYSDSPRYIYEAAVEAGLHRVGLRPVWSHVWRRPEGFPADVETVRRESWRYYYLMARAQYWVDNQGFPRVFTRRRETTYLQTWHGTPLKRMGFDSPSLERANAATRRAHKAMMRRWSALLVPSEYFVETFVKSYRYEGRLVRHGLPRNDLLVRGVDEDWVLAKKRELDLPTDRRLVLYCPTFRDRARRLQREYELPMDLTVMGDELGDDVHFLVRTHYLDTIRLSPRNAAFATDVSRHHDVTELLLLADVLVTDYSSVMFDFANTGRPMVFFTHDYEDYTRDERGTYLDLARIAPGPLVEDTAGLVRALREVDTTRGAYAEKYAAFRDRFCEYETGRAAEHVVKEFFGPLAGGGR
jgi:CDP-glycerol glycerophosphotransferase